jgi:hypothetical protein
MYRKLYIMIVAPNKAVKPFAVLTRTLSTPQLLGQGVARANALC